MSYSFVADAMLGSLAKWLRILGYDTLFDPALDDHQLARLALAQNRVLLTRDRALAQKRGIRTLLIGSEQLEDQIRQVLADLRLEPERAFSRCPVCNEPLEPIDREAVQHRVPAYVARTQKSFKQCPGCGRVYWRGSHWKQMAEHLARMQLQDDSRGAQAPSR